MRFYSTKNDVGIFDDASFVKRITQNKTKQNKESFFFPFVKLLNSTFFGHFKCFKVFDISPNFHGNNKSASNKTQFYDAKSARLKCRTSK